MPLSPSTIQDIKTELAEIRALKATLETRERALEAILVPFNVSSTPTRPHQAGEVVAAVGVEHHPKTGASTGLRTAILDTLKARGPMRSPDIAVVLEKAGFPNESSTPLATRVYNDLWRMAQKGIVRSDTGVFSLK
jgi:hypothetical protein